MEFKIYKRTNLDDQGNYYLILCMKLDNKQLVYIYYKIKILKENQFFISFIILFLIGICLLKIIITIFLNHIK